MIAHINNERRTAANFHFPVPQIKSTAETAAANQMIENIAKHVMYGSPTL